MPHGWRNRFLFWNFYMSWYYLFFYYYTALNVLIHHWSQSLLHGFNAVVLGAERFFFRLRIPGAKLYLLKEDSFLSGLDLMYKVIYCVCICVCEVRFTWIICASVTSVSQWFDPFLTQISKQQSHRLFIKSLTKKLTLPSHMKLHG